MNRTYFTKNISGFIDHPETLSNDDIKKLLSDDKMGENYFINNTRIFLHKTHQPKGKPDRFISSKNKQRYSRIRLLGIGLVSLIRDFFQKR